MSDVAEIYAKIAPSSEPQIFAISTDRDTTIGTQHGVELWIPAGVLVDAAGNQVTGTINLNIEEAFTNAEVFVQPLSTVADGKLLASKGMLNIQATKDGAALQIKEGEFISLGFPGAETEYEGYELFYGAETQGGVVEWVLDNGQIVDTAANSIKPPVYIGVTLIDSESTIDSNHRSRKNEKFDALLDLTDFPSFKEDEITLFSSENIELHFHQTSNGHLRFESIIGSLSETRKEMLLKRINKMPEFQKDFGDSERKVRGYFSFTSDVSPLEKADLHFASFDRKISRLGWTNCDVFLSLEMETSEMTVVRPNDSTIVKLIFPDYKTMLTGWEEVSGKLLFGFVPIGQQVNVVAISPYGDDVRMSVTKTLTTKKFDAFAPFEVVTKEEMTRRLNALN